MSLFNRRPAPHSIFIRAVGLGLGLAGLAAAMPAQAQTVHHILEGYANSNLNDSTTLCGVTYTDPVPVRFVLSVNPTPIEVLSVIASYDATFTGSFKLGDEWKVAYTGSHTLSVQAGIQTDDRDQDDVWNMHGDTVGEYTLCDEATALPANSGFYLSVWGGGWLTSNEMPLPAYTTAELGLNGTDFFAFAGHETDPVNNRPWYSWFSTLSAGLAPEVTIDPSALTAVSFADQVEIAFTAVDDYTPDADLQLGWSCTAPDGTVASGTGSPISFYADVAGIWSCTASAQDSDGLIGTADVLVSTDANLPPVPQGNYIQQFTAKEGETVRFTVSAKDPEPNPPLTCSAAIKDSSYDATITLISATQLADGAVDCVFDMTVNSLGATADIVFFITVCDAYEACTTWQNTSRWVDDPSLDTTNGGGVVVAIDQLRDVQFRVCAEKECNDSFRHMLDAVIQRLLTKDGDVIGTGSMDELKLRADGVGTGKEKDLVTPEVQPEVYRALLEVEASLATP